MWKKINPGMELVIEKMRRKTCFEDSGKGVCAGKKTKKGQLYVMCQDCSRMKMKEEKKVTVFEEEWKDITDRFKKSGYDLSKIPIVGKD